MTNSPAQRMRTQNETPLGRHVESSRLFQSAPTTHQTAGTKKGKEGGGGGSNPQRFSTLLHFFPSSGSCISIFDTMFGLTVTAKHFFFCLLKAYFSMFGGCRSHMRGILSMPVIALFLTRGLMETEARHVSTQRNDFFD